ncbi:MAG: ferric reductase-like transmembrane domain-containing protein [Candidatus Pelagadaptatus aseana]|uniref:ferredoxin reductase family protein n=1 Tax=Candidatus Pelagadaptatus aseana TaxID=3120508 RepID=UPI0039B2BD2A
MRFRHFILTPLILTTAVAGCWLVLPADLEMKRKVPALFAAISMLSMAVALWLGIRPKLADILFGGMDKAYQWHKWLGISGLLGASLHWALVPGPAGGDVIPAIAESGEEMGEVAMYLLLLLGCISFLRFLPYNIWHKTHQLMGPIFLISVYHTFFSDVPFTINSLTGYVLLAISALGVGSWVYKILLYKRHINSYKVVKLVQLDGAVEVTLAPRSDKTVKHQPGQFAYVDFNLKGVNEFHPYTIASSGSGDKLVFVIRALGDHTSELQQSIELGQTVQVDGPYGRLYKHRVHEKPQIWLAGGIGITPFLAWLKALRLNSIEQPTQEIHLFYSGEGQLFRQFAPYLVKLQSPLQTVKLHAIDTTDKTSGRLTGEKIKQCIDQPLRNYQIFACGPKPMLKALRSQLRQLGMNGYQWHNERFDMR